MKDAVSSCTEHVDTETTLIAFDIFLNTKQPFLTLDISSFDSTVQPACSLQSAEGKKKNDQIIVSMTAK